MPHMRFPFPLFSGGLMLVVAIAALGLAVGQAVEAQCGTQASSCKNCHEVQGELPVNNDGTGWHESHAFGDFCYVCHAGNQQATDMTEAHTGMVAPLSDIDASCKMCHAADLQDRAMVYASILNVSLGDGSGGSTSSEPTTPPSDDDFWGGGSTASEPVATTVPVEPAEPVVEPAASNIPVSNELVIDDASMVDYVQRYDEIVLGKQPTNWGNIILSVLIGLLVVGGGGFVILNEIRNHTVLGETRVPEGQYPADVVDMLPALAGMKSQNRQTLRKILNNPQKTDKVLGLIDSVIGDEQVEE